MKLDGAPIATNVVEDACAGMRVDLYAFQHFPEFLCSRSRSRKAANKGFVRVNGR